MSRLPKVSQVLNVFKVRETGNKEFWISHAVVFLSTVLGVYLAAQAGYRTAIDFEVTRSERDGYFMRVALLDEVKDNLALAEKFAAVFIAQKGESWGQNLEDFKLKDYVWRTMQQQSTTFQLPGEILSAVRRFNETVEDKVKEIGHISKVTLQGGTQITIFQGEYAEKLVPPAQSIRNEVKKMREVTVPALERNIADLRSVLIDKRVPLS